MAKPPPEERFRVVCNHVAKEKLGDVMAALAKLDINDVSFDLVTDVKMFNKRITHDLKAEDFLKQWIADGHAEFKASDAVTYFDLHNRTAGAAYTALRTLVEKKELRKVGKAQYGPPLKLLTHHKPKKAKATKKQDRSAPRHTTSNAAYLISWANKFHGGVINRAKAIGALRQAHRSSAGISSTLRDLQADGRIERMEEGVYKVLKKNGNGAAVPAGVDEAQPHA